MAIVAALDIKIDQLTRAFGGRPVFRCQTLNFVGPGILILEGDNGSGKTTLLKILANLVSEDEGEVLLNGYPPRAIELKRNLAFLPANENSFFPRLTGAENLQLFGLARGLKAKDLAARTLWLREHLKLGAALETPYLAASNGMKQTLAIARALLHDPDILLLDEPTRNLDRTAANLFRELMQTLAQKKLIVIATHLDADKVPAKAVWQFRDGQIKEEHA